MACTKSTEQSHSLLCNQQLASRNKFLRAVMQAHYSSYSARCTKIGSMARQLPEQVPCGNRTAMRLTLLQRLHCKRVLAPCAELPAFHWGGPELTFQFLTSPSVKPSGASHALRRGARQSPEEVVCRSRTGFRRPLLQRLLCRQVMAPSAWLLALHQEAPDLRIPFPDMAARTVLHM